MKKYKIIIIALVVIVLIPVGILAANYIGSPLSIDEISPIINKCEKTAIVETQNFDETTNLEIKMLYPTNDGKYNEKYLKDLLNIPEGELTKDQRDALYQFAINSKCTNKYHFEAYGKVNKYDWEREFTKEDIGTLNEYLNNDSYKHIIGKTSVIDVTSKEQCYALIAQLIDSYVKGTHTLPAKYLDSNKRSLFCLKEECTMKQIKHMFRDFKNNKPRTMEVVEVQFIDSKGKEIYHNSYLSATSHVSD